MTLYSHAVSPRKNTSPAGFVRRLKTSFAASNILRRLKPDFFSSVMWLKQVWSVRGKMELTYLIFRAGETQQLNYRQGWRFHIFIIYKIFIYDLTLVLQNVKIGRRRGRDRGIGTGNDQKPKLQPGCNTLGVSLSVEPARLSFSVASARQQIRSSVHKLA